MILVQSTIIFCFCIADNAMCFKSVISTEGAACFKFVILTEGAQHRSGEISRSLEENSRYFLLHASMPGLSAQAFPGDLRKKHPKFLLSFAVSLLISADTHVISTEGAQHRSGEIWRFLHYASLQSK